MATTHRRSERRARARALQAVYAWDVRGDGATLEHTAFRVWDDLGVAPVERSLAAVHVRRLQAHRDALDTSLAAITDNWRLERLGAIERSLLRLGAAELAHSETPPKVVLQETVRLAERFGTERSAKFVNGVLDAFARAHGRL